MHVNNDDDDVLCFCTLPQAPPPCYDHKNDGEIINLDKQAEWAETTEKRNSVTKSAFVDMQNVTTAVEVHSPNCNSNLA